MRKFCSLIPSKTNYSLYSNNHQNPPLVNSTALFCVFKNFVNSQQNLQLTPLPLDLTYGERNAEVYIKFIARENEHNEPLSE